MEPEKEVKPCVKCGARDRYKRGDCRPCVLEKNRRYYEQNSEKVREAIRRYREENPEKVRETTRRYWEENPEKVREASRRYREENPEKVRKAKSRYYEQNREKVRKAKSRYRQENREKLLEATRRYYKQNREKLLEAKSRYRQENHEKVLEAERRKKHTRRARKKNPNYPNDRLSRGLKGKLMKLQKGKCAYANAPLAHWCAIDIRKENHMDHIMPLALDGRNIDSNMQLTCPACNLHKSDSHPDDFARRVGLIV